MKRSITAAALVSLVACGGGSDGPTGPSPSVSAPTLTSEYEHLYRADRAVRGDGWRIDALGWRQFQRGDD